MSNEGQVLPDRGDDVKFSSKDIATNTKAGQKKKFFVKFKEKSAGEKFSDWISKHRKKILIILCAVVLLTVAVFVTIYIIQINSKTTEPTTEELTTEISNQETEINDYLLDISAESDSPYDDTSAHYKELFDAETDPDKKFTIAIAWADFLVTNDLWDDALTVYGYLDSSTMNDEQKLIYYRSIRDVYMLQGNEAMAANYDSLIEATPGGEFMESGGGA